MVGLGVGLCVGAWLGSAVGICVGETVGCAEGELVGSALGANVGTAVGAALGDADGADVSQSGAGCDDQPTDPGPATLHVRVVAALIVNPLKQRYVAVVGALML